MAAITLIHMSPKLRGPAYLDGVHGAELVYGKPVGFSVWGTMMAEYIGHFYGMHERY